MIKPNDVIQFTENHKWCGCLGIVLNDKGYDHPRRYVIGVPVPGNGIEYIFCDGSNIERVGEAVMVEREDEE